MRRSTLSDANNNRNHEIYRDIFFSLSSRVSSLAPKYKLKLSKKLYILEKRRSVRRSTGITSDHEIEFTGLNTRKKYPGKFRRIRYVDPETGKAHTFLTNNFKLAARTIANIYKARWEIELFFKCIKQNLKIKRFFGTTPNAVFTQIWIAMIAYLLASFYKFTLKTKHSIQQIFRLVKVQLFEKRSLQEVFLNDIVGPPKSAGINQMNLSILTGH